MTVTGNSNSNNARHIIRAAIQDVDVANQHATAFTQKSGIISVDTSHYVGAVQVTPVVGEQWYVELVEGTYRLHSRIPYNDPNQMTAPVSGQHVVGSGQGPVELNATQVNVNAPAIRMGTTLYRDSSGTLQSSTNGGSVWNPVGGGGGGGLGEIFNEIPAGAVNGVNLTFTTTYHYGAGTTRVYINSLREVPGASYNESPPSTVVFITAPGLGDVVTIDYVRVP